MNDKTYIVWVGGVADYEGSSYELASDIALAWKQQGYDDVILETVKVNE